MAALLRASAAIAVLLALAGCLDPKDRRPGLHLSGPVVEFPADWSFTDSHREIAIEVSTPYLLPHSVTIWCVALDGDLYVGARDPESKSWPGWVEADPDVRLKIGDDVYEARLAVIEDPGPVARLRRAYAAKYELPDDASRASVATRYWRVEPRSQ